MADNGLDVLIEEQEKTKIVIAGKEFYIGKLKLKTVLKLAKFIGKYFVKWTEKLKNIKDGKTNIDDLLNFFDLLDDDQIAQVIMILLEIEDIEFCKEIGFEEFTDIILTICEHNDLDKILKKVERVIGLITKAKTKMRS